MKNQFLDQLNLYIQNHEPETTGYKLAYDTRETIFTETDNMEDWELDSYIDTLIDDIDESKEDPETPYDYSPEEIEELLKYNLTKEIINFKE